VTTILAERLALISSLSLGRHAPPDGDEIHGACFIEAASYIAGEPWSDRTPCVSPVIAAFGRSWNDALPDGDRTRLLLPLLEEVVGTSTGLADEEARAWMATDWLARVHTPAWLRLAGLDAHARALEACARIVDVATATDAQSRLAAASDAAYRAAGAAARHAASDAAYRAAGAAARHAASASASYEASDEARYAASATASAAAGAAAYHAGAAAYHAGAAARDALAPTVAELQESAVQLLRDMCAVGRPASGGASR
jgi:hypothetical protein